MKFTLKDYQEESVKEVLNNLQDARDFWQSRKRKTAFSLTATTGAGKTVMAAAVFEALFHGDDNFDVAADPGAVVIWFSDDPSLNEQSRGRLLQASDRLNLSDLVVVQNTFQREKLEPGKIYFLNTHKLGRSSLLVRGHEEAVDGVEKSGQMRLMPDDRSHTIWDTIQNTIEDPNLTLYLLLDEAHRGMRTSTGAAEKTTIVKRLINGSGTVPGIPIVLGISATVARFNAAMAEATGRGTLPNVVVDSAKVQTSGLLKDTIILDVPKGSNASKTTLVRRGTTKLKEITAAWEAYGQEQKDAPPVVPLMVVQVQNKPSAADIAEVLDAIFDQWPELPEGCIAHVFGEHNEHTFGRHKVTYVSPERVQDQSWIRVLLAKDAISTGWDCPRAEVMVSFRPAHEDTYITQLLGRMVRTPLARRIPGNDRLNSVDCLLPLFDEDSVKRIAEALTSGGDGEEKIPGRRILINPTEMKPNPTIPEEVWNRFSSLPSQSLPKKHARPIKRLTSLAHELAADDLLPNGGRIAHSEMHKVLDEAQAQYVAEIAAARQSVLTVEGRTVRAAMGGGGMTFDNFVEDADFAVIDDAFRRAGRAISPDLAITYAEYIAAKHGDADDQEGALLDARVLIASLGLVTNIRTKVEAAAEDLSNQWLNHFRGQIAGLSHDRQEVFRQIREMSAKPLDVDLAVPTSSMQPTTVREADGTEKALPTFARHLLCNDQGKFPVDFGSSWEAKVIEKELGNAGCVAWYRNPARGTPDSLGIIYELDGESKIMRPDFIFFSQIGDGSIVADIVDPHGLQFDDALPKLKGLAAYAERFGDKYRRIEGVAEVGTFYRALNMKDHTIRAAVAAATSAGALFSGLAATDYTF